MNKFQLLLVVLMQKTFRKLYHSTGLTGIDASDVLLRPSEFLHLFGKCAVKDRHDKTYPLKVERTWGGVVFEAIGTEEEFKKVGLI